MSNDAQLVVTLLMIIVVPPGVFLLGWTLGASYTARVLGKKK